MKQISTYEVRLLDQSGAAFDAAPLPAAGAKRQSEIVELAPSYVGRGVLVAWLAYIAAAAAGAPHVRLLGSAKQTAPDLGDDSWADLGLTDGSVTPSIAFAGGPAVMGQALLQPNLVRLPSAPGAGAMPALAISFRSPYRWLYIEAAEIGAPGTPGTLRLGVSCI